MTWVSAHFFHPCHCLPSHIMYRQHPFYTKIHRAPPAHPTCWSYIIIPSSAPLLPPQRVVYREKCSFVSLPCRVCRMRKMVEITYIVLMFVDRMNRMFMCMMYACRMVTIIVSKVIDSTVMEICSMNIVCMPVNVDKILNTACSRRYMITVNMVLRWWLFHFTAQNVYCL